MKDLIKQELTKVALQHLDSLFRLADDVEGIDKSYLEEIYRNLTVNVQKLNYT